MILRCPRESRSHGPEVPLADILPILPSQPQKAGGAQAANQTLSFTSLGPHCTHGDLKPSVSL